MKAAVVERLGLFEVKEVPNPEVILEIPFIRVEACAICGSDIRIFRKGDPRAILPRIIGHEIAGTVKKLGKGTTGFSIGDNVTITPGHGCGICTYCRRGMGNMRIDPRPSVGYASSGGFAQYIVKPLNVVQNRFVNQIPDCLSFEDASMAELLACCINGQEQACVGTGNACWLSEPALPIVCTWNSHWCATCVRSCSCSARGHPTMSSDHPPGGVESASCCHRDDGGGERVFPHGNGYF